MARHWSRRIFPALCAAALLLPMAACGNSGAPDTIKIGLLQPMTGASSGYGAGTQAGFKYVVDRINATGGIKKLDGAKIEIVLADTASTPTQAATEARRLMGKEGVSLVAGTLLTPEMAAVSPVADQNQVPVLAFLAAGTTGDQVYSLGSPYGDGYAQVMTDFIGYLNTRGAGLRKVVLSSSNFETGQVVDKEMTARLAKAGLGVAGTVPLNQGATDFGPAVQKIGAIRGDVVSSVVTEKDGIQLAKARAAAGLQTLFVGSGSGYGDRAVWDALDQQSRNILQNRTFAMVGFAGGSQQASTKAFIDQVRHDLPGATVSQNFVIGAQAARVVQRALEQAGSTEPSEVYRAIARVDIPASDPDLYLARQKGITFSPGGGFARNIQNLVVQWNADGTQDVVWPEHFAVRPPRLP